MPHSIVGFGGGVVAPHHLAAAAGRSTLEDGGSAIEAMVAMAACIAVVYPHMNSIGGDGFWLIRRPGKAPEAIMACGRAAANATPEAYLAAGETDIPARGPRAALTAPAAVAGWIEALALQADDRPQTALDRLLAPAIRHAEHGFAVTVSQAEATAQKLAELRDAPGFLETFAPDGPPVAGARLRLPALARTLDRLARRGLDDFYNGAIAAAHARFLAEIGSPLDAADLAAVAAERARPLSLELKIGRVYNTPPPTQGAASLIILGLFERLGVANAEGVEHVHALVEATKQALILRDAELADPDAMAQEAQAWLDAERLDAMAAPIDPNRAAPWPHVAAPGDTVWMGAADATGCVVSYIQSIYWEFGSGCVCPETGVLFQNRGAGFSLAPGRNRLAPGKRPRHTLNPPLAVLADGRVLAYGCMGGDGQPQTQAAVLTRVAHFGAGLAEAIAAPRWLLGRTWGDVSTNLKLESRFDPALVAALRKAGHEIEMLPAFSELTGHAGAVALGPDGAVEAATDPRCDGAALVT